MKRFILPLMLLLFVGTIFAVESDPSEIVGYVKYDCLPGLNFVAMPMVDGNSFTSEVAAIYTADADIIDAINIWSSDTQTWDHAVNYGGGFWDPDLEVGPGSILYFNSSEPFAFYSIGSLPTADAIYNIVPGLNTIMIPLNKSDLTLTSEVGITIGDGEFIDAINIWSSETQTWDHAVNYGGGFWDPDLPVSIGMPLYINSMDSTTWPARSAGIEPLRASKK
ncbi:MAG: hypothetical protein PHC50_06765 [Candidatus Cloacimonetes bacterium]|nr:hypothetical protein [Candidatus Cloacimonadota bacterium]